MEKKFARIKLVNIDIYLFIMLLFCVNMTNNRPLSCAADKFADGCSVPSVFPAPFKKEFTSACNRHDICYGCGYHYNWSRSACDESFYRNMKIICENLRVRRSFFESLLDNIVTTFHSMGSTKSQCEAAAKMYYEGVHLFASSHFDKTDHDYCVSECAFKHGSPEFNITR